MGRQKNKLNRPAKVGEVKQKVSLPSSVWQKFLRLKPKFKLVVVVLTLVLLLAIWWVILFWPRSGQEQAIISTCGNDKALLSEKHEKIQNGLFNRDISVDLGSIMTEGYDKTPDCLFVVTEHNIEMGNIQEAEKNYNLLLSLGSTPQKSLFKGVNEDPLNYINKKIEIRKKQLEQVEQNYQYMGDKE